MVESTLTDRTAARPMLVGERLNAQGSRRTQQRLLSGDYDALVAIGREQLAQGAQALDVCVALDGRHDEDATMSALVSRLAAAVDVPLFIDSADPRVLVRALPHAGSRGVANSITLAHGSRDAALVTPTVRQYGARLVALCIDETGMAESATRKLAVAKRIHRELVGGCGLDARALIIDVLTFPLATDRLERRGAALETIAAVRLLREALPDVQTILGISDVSFGMPLSARPILNAVFLHHCAEAGLDMAIVNPATLCPYHRLTKDQRDVAEDLIFNRRADALQRFTMMLSERTREA